MKMKHNKKRNTAFLYESLIKELTKSMVNKDENKKQIIIKIIKEYFRGSSVLKQDLEIYNLLSGTHDLEGEFAKRFMFEVKRDYWSINRKEVFNTQTRLLKQINESLSNKIFANFISNYRDIASIGQFLNSHKSKPKTRLIVEDRVLEMLTIKKDIDDKMQHIDKLTYKTFVNKFNDQYAKFLRKEQKDLLTNYITSFSDNGLQFKAFLNEEIGRLKTEVSQVQSSKFILKNRNYEKKITAVLEKLNEFSNRPIDEKMIHEIFYIQNLIVEISKNGN